MRAEWTNEALTDAEMVATYEEHLLRDTDTKCGDMGIPAVAHTSKQARTHHKLPVETPPHQKQD